tara:strand:- start:6759 stop:7031 length:273 start_codon:yes stop_codon:yes gene_type:complete
MTIQEAIEILEAHNKWRRDRSEEQTLKMADPTKLGIAIDTVVDFHKPKCSKCRHLDANYDHTLQKTYFCELTEETINDINQHYCGKFKKV